MGAACSSKTANSVHKNLPAKQGKNGFLIVKKNSTSLDTKYSKSITLPLLKKNTFSRSKVHIANNENQNTGGSEDVDTNYGESVKTNSTAGTTSKYSAYIPSSRILEVNYQKIPNKIHKKATLAEENTILGRVGLYNLGNTCFMNSALQCLSNIQPLSDYFLNCLHENEINKNNVLGSKGVVTAAYANLIKNLWTTSNKTIRPSDFLSTVRMFAPQFGVGTQEDAHEFLAYLLDILHEDLNRVIQKPYIEEKDYFGKIVYEEQAAESWKNYLSRNKSVIVDLFQGQLKSTLTCLKCGKISNKFESFMYLSVPILEKDSKRGISVESCIKEFTKEEKLDKQEKWYCPECKEFRVSLKKIEIWKVPNILVIHIKRFLYTKTRRGKIRTKLDFPLRDWDLSSFISGRQKSSPMYDLFAVCNHEGSLVGGHYTTLAKNRDDKNWYLFDDSSVSRMNILSDRICSSEAYLLFYSKTSVEDFHRQTISNPEFWPHIIDVEKFMQEQKMEQKPHRKSREMSLRNYLHREVAQPTLEMEKNIMKNFMPLSLLKAKRKSPNARIKQSTTLNEADLTSNDPLYLKKYVKPTITVKDNDNFMDDFLKGDDAALDSGAKDRREPEKQKRSNSKNKLETSVDNMFKELDDFAVNKLTLNETRHKVPRKVDADTSPPESGKKEEEDDFSKKFSKRFQNINQFNFDAGPGSNNEQSMDSSYSSDRISVLDEFAQPDGLGLDKLSLGSSPDAERDFDPCYDFQTASSARIQSKYLKAQNIGKILLGPSPRNAPLIEAGKNDPESRLTSVQELEEEQEENGRASVSKANELEIKSLTSIKNDQEKEGEEAVDEFDPETYLTENNLKKDKFNSLDESFSPERNFKKTETLWKQRSLHYDKDEKPERMRQSRKFRHIKFIIFPDDPFKDVWDISQAVLIVYTIIYFPFELAFMQLNDNEEDPIGLRVIDYITTILFTIDIIMNFLSAYHDDKDNLITSRRKIARTYLKGWFIVDFFTVFPFDVVFETSKYNSLARVARLSRLSRLSKLMKFMRIFKVLREKDKIIEYVQNMFQSALWVGRLLLAIFSLLMFCHVGACGWVLSANMEDSTSNWIDYYGYTDDDTGTIYTAAFYWISQTVITTGYGDIAPKNTGERFYACVLMLSGVIFYSFCIASITSLITKLDEKKMNQDDKMNTLIKIRREYRIDKGLFDRLKRAVKIDQFFKQEISDLFNHLPPYLRTDLAFLMYRDLVLTIDFFQDKSVKLVAEIGPCLKKVMVKPEEFILVRGESANEMYFIKKGKIAVCMPGNFIEFAYLEEGSFFGGLDIILERNRTYDYKAKEESTLLMLDKKNFQRIFFQDFYNYGAEFYKESLKNQISLRTLYKEAVDYYKTLMREQEESKRAANPSASPARLSKMSKKQRDSITKRFWKKDRKFRENTNKLDQQLEGLTSEPLSKTGSNEIVLFKDRKDSPDIHTLEKLSNMLGKTDSLDVAEPDATPHPSFHKTLLRNMSKDKSEKFVWAQEKLKTVVEKIYHRNSIAKMEYLVSQIDQDGRLEQLAIRMEKTEADFRDALEGLSRAGLPIKLGPNFNPPKIIINDFKYVSPKGRRVTDILDSRERDRTPISAEQYKQLFINRNKKVF